ncbi:hypothetical protein GCM10012275_00340 [Longimycelium tulufanense]|uniref:Ornithine cyclodeaminase n=1 Tax=Longimycelium tulufanense TaxID=907463 RepID=A0A8J3C5S5_9PSEU|nr:2,3-diaminopropionate biosynthesis protein SbnB [Longimycelium tulufanense]GGM32872.1 hypothetical protein GCM10012275_00340 [Longimycelium tulufanense]
MFPFHVIKGPVVRDIITRARPEIVALVRETYLAHHTGHSVNPNSYFLRFPEKPNARIIALPAYLGEKHDVAGLKWIGSFPDNIERNVPRASAVLLLNSYETGYPFACVEASQISAARTAASAVLGARELVGGTQVGTVSVIGAGIIARNISEFFLAEGWSINRFVIHDHSPQYSSSLVEYLRNQGQEAVCAENVEATLKGADVVVFATTAGKPHVTRPDSFVAGQIVLNISLRDLGPEVILNARNVLDDVDHCMTANTSPHLAEQKYGHRDFIDGTLSQVMCGEVTVDTDRPTIFSPFGLGVLDLAVGNHVYRKALEEGLAVEITDFFDETERWRSHS